MTKPSTQHLSPRDRALYEEKRRKYLAHRRRKRTAALLYALRVLILGLAASALFGVLMIAAVKYDFSKTPEKYTYSLKVVRDGKTLSLAKGITVKNNTCYIALSDFSELLGFRLMGDVHVMNAVFDDESRISVYVGTDNARFGDSLRLLRAPSYFSGLDGDVYVPISFFENTFDGAELTGVKSGRKIDYTLTLADPIRPALTAAAPIALPDTTGLHFSTAPGSAFLTDLSAYEMYMDPEDTDAYIRLINTAHPLDKDYIPEDLIEISDTRKDRKAVQMREYAAKALDAMFIEMRAAGFTDVSVTSAYRSYDYQTTLFNNSVNRFMKSYDYNTAYAKTAAEIAIPGTSEHQSGLCADLHNLPSASQLFEAEDVYKWLYTHCADFGFILRFPKNKSEITGIIFEPWHYRYVGRYHAQKIMQSGLCLEEYCEQNGLGLN